MKMLNINTKCIESNLKRTKVTLLTKQMPKTITVKKLVHCQLILRFFVKICIIIYIFETIPKMTLEKNCRFSPWTVIQFSNLHFSQ